MKKLFILGFILIFFISCNDNPPIYTVPEPIKFFPLKVGNYWVYESYSLDERYKKISGTESIDSFSIVSRQFISGKMAFVILRFNNNKLIDTLFLVKENKQLFRFHNASEDSISGLGSGWLKIGDLNFKTWNIFADIRKDSNFVFENKQVVVNRHYTINGTILDLVKIPFQADSITVLPITYKDDRKFYFDFYFNDDTSKSNIEIITLKQERFWLKDSIGIIIWQFDPFKIITRSDSLNQYNPPKSVSFHGWKRQLLRYKAEE